MPLRFTLNWDAIKMYEQLAEFTVDMEQTNLREQINGSNHRLFSNHALVAVARPR